MVKVLFETNRQEMVYSVCKTRRRYYGHLQVFEQHNTKGRGLIVCVSRTNGLKELELKQELMGGIYREVFEYMRKYMSTFPNCTSCLAPESAHPYCKFSSRNWLATCQGCCSSFLHQEGTGLDDLQDPILIHWGIVTRVIIWVWHFTKLLKNVLKLFSALSDKKI